MVSSLECFDKELERIIADKNSGSSEILFSLNGLFKKHFGRINNINPLINRLQKEFKSFQNIQSYLKDVKTLIRKGALTKQFFENYSSAHSNVYRKIFKSALPFLKRKKKILTLSNSKTIFEVLRMLHKSNSQLAVIVCESRPKFEGRILAKKLAEDNINTTIITEAMIAKFIPKCDCVITGADTVLKNKSIVNKVGSLQTAILCRYFNRPFYVLADKSKFTNTAKLSQHFQDEKEIWARIPAGIRMENLYFEIVPKELITKIFTS